MRDSSPGLRSAPSGLQAAARSIMHHSQLTILLVLLLSAAVSADLARTLRTGRARGRGGTITRQKRPERYWRYVYGDCAVLVLCAVALLRMIISPESF
jgi:hypothetical protein